jgi:hypothetical protein
MIGVGLCIGVRFERLTYGVYCIYYIILLYIILLYIIILYIHIHIHIYLFILSYLILYSSHLLFSSPLSFPNILFFINLFLFLSQYSSTNLLLSPSSVSQIYLPLIILYLSALTYPHLCSIIISSVLLFLHNTPSSPSHLPILFFCL